MVRPNRSQEDLTSKAEKLLCNDEAKLLSDDDGRYLRGLQRSLTDYPPSLLYADEDYCVIDKPHDVRMDGDFAVTVERLVPHWLGLSAEEKALKWIHQLDFATSGVLCIGRNRAAVAAACSAFEHRQTHKEYLAVLQGHLSLEDWPRRTAALPLDLLELSQYKEITLPNSHHISIINRKKNRKRALLAAAEAEESANTAPAETAAKNNNSNSNNNTTSLSWQDEVMLKNLQTCYAAFQALREPSHPQHGALEEQLKDLRWKQDFEKLVNAPWTKLQHAPKLRKALRKLLANCGVEVTLLDSNPSALDGETASKAKSTAETEAVTHTETDTVEDNDKDDSTQPPHTTVTPLTTEEVEVLCTTKFRNKSLEIPFIYHLDEGPTGRNCLMVNIPVAEIEGDFRMEPGHEENRGKTSITEVHILEHATYKTQPVTKVLFKPLTGRRHQLRIHSLCLGHPIVGDYTYNTYHRELVHSHFMGDSDDAALSAHEKRRDNTLLLAERMMLHAHSLTIPFPTVGKCPEPFKKGLLKKYMDRRDITDENSLSETEKQKMLVETPLIQEKAPDPFVIEDGELVVKIDQQ